LRLRVVVKSRSEKTITCETVKAGLEVVVPKGDRTTTSEVREARADASVLTEG